MSEVDIGSFVINYQKFTDNDDPLAPFLCRVVGKTSAHWIVQHPTKEGTIKKRRINKGCCSSNPVKPGVWMSNYLEIFGELEKVKSKPKVEIKPRVSSSSSTRVKLKLGS